MQPAEDILRTGSLFDDSQITSIYIWGKPPRVNFGCAEREKKSNRSLSYILHFLSIGKLGGKKVVLRFGMIKRSACNSISLPIHAKNL